LKGWMVRISLSQFCYLYSGLVPQPVVHTTRDGWIEREVSHMGTRTAVREKFSKRARKMSVESFRTS
jgi:hypothetical protein